MAIPSSYTEAELGAYMQSLITQDTTVNELTSQLSWSVDNDSYDEAVNEALAVYGTDDISTITGFSNIRSLRIIARVELWRLVMQRTVPAYQATDGRLAASRNQLYEHAKDMYNMFLSEASAYYEDVQFLSRMGSAIVERTEDT